MFILLVLTISVANAEVYKWEDANGVHFTDNPSSVPAKYRKRQPLEPTSESKAMNPQASTGTNQLASPTMTQTYVPPAIQPTTQQSQATIYQANLEKQKRAMEVVRQQQARALAVNTQNAERAANAFVKFMAVWLLIGGAIFVAWISTIVDIVKSDFTVSSNKTVWMLLVIFLPLLGMLLYFIFGTNQKSRASGWGDNRGFKGRGPDIY
ncbi:PLDc N-terminal domain-containing protein [Geomonas oryzisoli]|uniref:PLDc N-terminal domain-containing protein n=1 Tax=Geomonas oryzisoli TaxID=2847992 RepID=A0ABX8J8X7_9BACT|nr:PLDc N-terminal domain-containing protein [Geomonas oryzisoli]QWV94883.1 PLDc N-terminal domain-containing protein [Geomonas oryzisoli]